jgi:hypothetical protein
MLASFPFDLRDEKILFHAPRFFLNGSESVYSSGVCEWPGFFIPGHG